MRFAQEFLVPICFALLMISQEAKDSQEFGRVIEPIYRMYSFILTITMGIWSYILTSPLLLHLYMKWCLCIGVLCCDSRTSSHGVFGNKTGRPGVSPGGADHQVCGRYWTTGKGTLFLWLDVSSWYPNNDWTGQIRVAKSHGLRSG